MTHTPSISSISLHDTLLLDAVDAAAKDEDDDEDDDDEDDDDEDDEDDMDVDNAGTALVSIFGRLLEIDVCDAVRRWKWWCTCFSVGSTINVYGIAATHCCLLLLLLLSLPLPLLGDETVVLSVSSVLSVLMDRDKRNCKSSAVAA